eukprot:SAG11_NODE_9173_length_935_cov_1.733254_1_plen_156_part_01
MQLAFLMQGVGGAACVCEFAPLQICCMGLFYISVISVDGALPVCSGTRRTVAAESRDASIDGSGWWHVWRWCVACNIRRVFSQVYSRNAFYYKVHSISRGYHMLDRHDPGRFRRDDASTLASMPWRWPARWLRDRHHVRALPMTQNTRRMTSAEAN